MLAKGTAEGTAQIALVGRLVRETTPLAGMTVRFSENRFGDFRLAEAIGEPATANALTALHEAPLRVATADLPAEVAAALALSKLTALRKPGGRLRPMPSTGWKAPRRPWGQVATREEGAPDGPAGGGLRASLLRALRDSCPTLSGSAARRRTTFIA